MIKTVYLKIRLFFLQGHSRTIVAKKNIVASFLIKGCSIAISLALVPLTIHYINPTRYGIWLTLSAVIAWFSFFDLGLGNGLRNRLAEALASGQKEVVRIYVSTTYAILSIIIGGVLILFAAINPFLNWAEILNTPPEMASELSILALVVFVFFCIQFVLKLITTILTADQKPAMAAFLNLIGNSISLLIIFILTKTTHENLLYLGITLSVTPVIVLFVSSLWFYSREYKYYAPSFKFIKFSYSKNIMDLGLKFFFIQISAILIFQIDSIVIAHLFGPIQVTSYNISFKYFSIITMGFSIITTPFWSAYTEAWVKGDVAWIKRSINKLQYIWCITTIVTIVMLSFSEFFYHAWVGDSVNMSFTLSLSMALNGIIISWNTIYVMFINGIGVLKIQLLSGIFGLLLSIPLSIYFGKLMGISGVVFATCFLGLINSCWTYVQYKKIINHTATGLWAK